MEMTFAYDKVASGKNFIARQKDVNTFNNLLMNGSSVAVYDVPKSGKSSLISFALTKASLEGEKFVVADVTLFRCRTAAEVLRTFASSVISSCCGSNSEIKDIFKKCLAGTNLCIDEDAYCDGGDIVALADDPDENDIRKVFELPMRISELKSTRVVTLVRQFQTILLTDEPEMMLKILEKVVQMQCARAPFIFTGSHLNAMKEIFEHKRYFWHDLEIMNLSRIDTVDFIAYVYRRFQDEGKVLEKDMIIGAVESLQNNPGYVIQYFSILNSIAKGFVNSRNLDEAMHCLVSIYRPQFFSTVCSLTSYQLSLLKATLDGEVKLSTAAVIDRYGLSSAANVKRLKDALVKKEVIYMDDRDEPHVQDSLFEYWLRKDYFAR